MTNIKCLQTMNYSSFKNLLIVREKIQSYCVKRHDVEILTCNFQNNSLVLDTDTSKF